MKLKGGSLKINKIYRPLARLIKKNQTGLKSVKLSVKK